MAIKRLTVKVNSAGVAAILKDPGVLADVQRRAEAVKAALPVDDGEEWFINSFIGHDRANAIVGTGNKKAKQTQAETLVLLKALDRGR